MALGGGKGKDPPSISQESSNFANFSMNLCLWASVVEIFKTEL
jgi:hypothetical protein